MSVANRTIERWGKEFDWPARIKAIEKSKIKPIPKRRGRRTKYRPEYVELVGKIVGETGCTDEKLADLISVSYATLKNWMSVYPEFLAAIKKGKWDHACLGIANSLVKRANGYQFKEITMEWNPLANEGKGGMTPTKVVTKDRAPDVAAQIFALCNRAKGEWQHVSRIEHTGKDGGPIELQHPEVENLFENFTTEERQEALGHIRAAASLIG